MVPSDLEDDETNEQDNAPDFDDMDDEEKIEHLQDKVTDLEAQLEAADATNDTQEEQLQEAKKLLEENAQLISDLRADLEVANAANAGLGDKLAAGEAVKAVGEPMAEGELKEALDRDVPTIRAIIAKVKGAESPLLPTLDNLLVSLQA